MRGALLAVALGLISGCGVSRAVSAEQSGDGGAGADLTFFSSISVCRGTAPRATFNGIEVTLGQVEAKAGANDGIVRSADYAHVDFPLPGSLLAQSLRVGFAAPWAAEFNEDLSRSSAGLQLEVTGTPVTGVAVFEQNVFSLQSSGQAQGNLVVRRRGNQKVVSLCLLFSRTSSWFRPDTAVLYAPELAYDPPL